MNLIDRAEQTATVAHSGQFRKYSSEQYIVHPQRVAQRLRELDAPDFAVAAAWLHDVLEDCPMHAGSTIAAFEDSPEVMQLVREVTNPSKGSPLPRAQRKQIDRDHLSRVSYWAKVLKLVDRIDNVRDLEQASPEFRQLYADETLLLVKILISDDSVIQRLAEELLAAVMQIKDAESP